MIIVANLLCFNLKAQTNITDSIVHQTYQRKFMVHFPPNFNTTTQRALVVSLHGGSGNMVNAQGFSMLNPVSDQNNFIVAWPQGYGIAPPGFSWADGRNTSADQAGVDDIGFIDKLIDTLITRYNVDTNKIYICGFSNGGFMVQRLACQLPDRFAAMASLGSSMDTVLYQNCNPSKPIPMAFFNGTADPAMPYGGGPMQNPQVIPVVPVDTTVQFWVTHNNCQTASPVFNFPDTFTTDNSTAELYTFTNCDCNADVKFYKLINGGHTWPGVYVATQASVLGNTNRDINASVELWNFFIEYTSLTTGGGGGVVPPNGTLSATGIRTRITQHSFQPTNELQLDSLLLWVINGGPRSHQVRAKAYAPPLNQAFSTPDSQFTIAAGDSIRIRLYFKPIHNIEHTGTLLLQPDGGSGPVAVQLSGQGRYSLSYYDPTQNLQGTALVTALQQRISSPYTSLGYTGTNNARLRMFGNIDNWKVNGREPTHPNPYKNECIYTGRTISYTSTAFNTSTLNNAPYQMNTEHTWPQSFGASAEPMQSDLHHIFISDANTNTARGNKPLDWVLNPTITYTGGSKANSTTFETRNEHKAAAAAAMLYFRLRYNGTAGVDLSYMTTAMEQTYRQWLSQYPPAVILRQRNADVATYQQNRNPFIDYPAFLDRIGGSLSSPTTPIVQAYFLPDTVRAGQISPGELRQLRIPVVNLGTSPINLSNIQVTGGALYTGSATATIAPGSSTYLHLELQWSTEGAKIGTLSAQTGLSGSLATLSTVWTAQVMQNRFQGQGLWNNPSLWSLGYVPLLTDRPLIASGEARVAGWWPQSGLSIAPGAGLKLDSGAVALPTQLHNDGLVVMNDGSRFVPADTMMVTGSGLFRVVRNGHTQPGMLNLWSSPVVGADLLQSFPTARPSGIRSYNGGSSGHSGWNPVPATGIMAGGQGYAIEAGALATFTGIPHQGPLAVTLSSPSGYYLLGNPYPAPISADSFLNLNGIAGSGVLGSAIYLWDQQTSSLQTQLSGTDYAVWAGGTGVAGSGSNGGAGATIPDGTLGVGQGFFVPGGTQTGQAWFRPSMRQTIAGGGALLRSASGGGNSSMGGQTTAAIGRLWIGIREADTSLPFRAFGQTAVVLRHDASASFDPLFDAPRWGMEAPLAVWTYGAQQSLAIQAVDWPLWDTYMTLPLGVHNQQTGSVIFAIDSLHSLPVSTFGGWNSSSHPSFATGQASNDFGIWLEDRLEGQWHDLLQAPARCHIASPGVHQRFFLHLGNLSHLSNTTANLIESPRPYLLHSDGELHVMGLKPGVELQIYDLKGALLGIFHPVVDGTWPIPAEYGHHGALIIRIRQSNQIHYLKIGRTG
jgi:polyhydroxybutyrate depolymerase